MRGEHKGQLVDKFDEICVIQCETCGFIHISPLPDPEALERDYRDNYYEDEARDRLAYYERDRDWWMISHGDVLAEIGSHMVPGTGRKLLDIGCGGGLFLEAARAAGWQVLGVEPGRAAVEHCRSKGLEVLQNTFDGAAPELPGPFDVIHLRNVLEHVPDPLAMVAKAASLLAPGGLLVVIVPNDYNPIQKALREQEGYRPWWVAVKHHLNYFNFESLERLASRHGLAPVSRFCSYPIDLFLAMGDNYIDTPSLGRESHLKRVRMETLFEKSGLASTRRALYRSFAEAGLGREACVIARRKV